MLRRLGSVAAAHGLDRLVAPVRPTWKERYPLVPIQRYAAWRRPDGLPFDPWLRAHERLGGEMLGSAPRSMTSRHARGVGGVDGHVFPDDGDYVVPARSSVHFKNGRGLYVEPNVWVRTPYSSRVLPHSLAVVGTSARKSAVFRAFVLKSRYLPRQTYGARRGAGEAYY